MGADSLKIKYNNIVIGLTICVLSCTLLTCLCWADFDFEGDKPFDSDNSFFPIGMYNVNPSRAFKELKDAGFNTVHTYEIKKKYLKRYLKEAEGVGVKVLIYPASRIKLDKFYSLDKVADAVKDLKDSPALLAWQLIDEPGLQKISPEDVNQMYQQILNVDKNHTTALIVAEVDKLEKYAPYTDIMMVDPYPVPTRPLTQVSDTIEKAREAVRDKKPVWAILQAFGYQNHKYKGWGRDREPTFEEERCMTYLAIVHGAKGIFYYTYHGSQYKIQLSKEHWKGLKRIAGELRTLTPILLSAESADKVQMKIRGEIIKDNNGDPAVHFLLKDFGGYRYLFAVNVVENPVEVSFNSTFGNISDLDVMFEDRKIALVENKFTDSFGSYAVHIYKIINK